MEKKGTTDRARKETFPKVPELFLETTAQFHRLTGPASFRETIEGLMSSAGKVGTSAHVKREFHYVYGGFFKSLIFNVGRLGDLSRARNFADMWSDVEHLMGKRPPGGPKLLSSIGRTLSEQFGKEPVSPKRVLNVLEGLKTRLLGGLKGDFVFDKSSCTVWINPHICQCDLPPGSECRLEEICINLRAEFLASLRTLAGTRCDEGEWLEANLHLLEAAQGKALKKLLGDHPGHVGDTVIFWEAPPGWTILTYDLAFRRLQRSHRSSELKIFILRLPRRASGGKCTIVPAEAAEEIDGVLIDHNSQGARIRAPKASVKRRQRVTIKAREFGRNGTGEKAREGRIVYIDRADPSVFAVRFPSK